MDLRARIIAALERASGTKSNGAEDSDVLGAFGLTGADATEFLDSFAEEFQTDLGGMIWYFHFNADESPNRRRVIPYDAVTRQIIPYDPITLDDLVRAASTGHWDRTYPKHNIGQSLFQRFAMTALAAGLILLLLVFAYI